jgi:uncharacterized protein (TIGR02996 family)
MASAHDKAFLADILEHPQDDAPRLIYADWLTDNGNPERGEFIRIQIERSHLDEDDPAQDELERRENHLLAAHPEWYGSAARWVHEGATFRRGFLDGLEGRPSDLVRAGAILLAKEPIRAVSLTRSQTGLAKVLALPGMERVVRLDLAGRQEHSLLFGWDRLPALEHLGLSTFPMTPADVRALVATRPERLTSLTLSWVAALLTEPGLLAQLESLHLLAGTADDAALRRLLRVSLPRLTELDLSYNRFSPSESQAVFEADLPALRKLTLNAWEHEETLAGPLLAQLTHLKLYGYSQREIPAFAPGGDLGQLRHLDLFSIPLGSALADLAARPQLEQLTRLRVRGTDGSLAAFPALVASPHLDRLVELTVLGMDVRASSETSFRTALDRWRLPALRRLTLVRNVITAELVARLAESPRLAGLTSLDLQGNLFSDAGARSLARSPHLTRLAALNLSYTNLGDTGVIELASSANLSGLWSLELIGNRFGPIGLQALADSPYLGRLRRLVVSRRNAGPQEEALSERFGHALHLL